MRQLRNEVMRLAACARQTVITEDDLWEGLPTPAPEQPRHPAGPAAASQEGGGRPGEADDCGGAAGDAQQPAAGCPAARPEPPGADQQDEALRHCGLIVFPIRPGREPDLPEVAAVQQASPEAAQWNVTDYLQYDFRVAEAGGRIAGFLVSRKLAEAESEVLNLAVAPGFRRQGIARELLQTFLRETPGVVYLEVRESNRIAREFYKSMGFKDFSYRGEYYESPGGLAETAIVMKFHSC